MEESGFLKVFGTNDICKESFTCLNGCKLLGKFFFTSIAECTMFLEESLELNILVTSNSDLLGNFFGTIFILLFVLLELDFVICNEFFEELLESITFVICKELFVNLIGQYCDSLFCLFVFNF